MKVIWVFFCRFLKFQVKLGEIFTKIKNFFFFFFFLRILLGQGCSLWPRVLLLSSSEPGPHSLPGGISSVGERPIESYASQAPGFLESCFSLKASTFGRANLDGSSHKEETPVK